MRVMIKLLLCFLALMMPVRSMAQEEQKFETTVVFPDYNESVILPPENALAALSTITASPKIDSLVERVFKSTLKEVDEAKLYTDKISITLIDISDPAHPLLGQMRGDSLWYPASIIKLAFMVYAAHLSQSGVISYDEPLRENVIEMVRPSSNVATQYVVDRITSTTAGLDLAPAELEKLKEKRMKPSNYMAKHGLKNIFALQKTWDDLPTGSELQLLGKPTDYHFEFSNKMTTNDTARLLFLIDAHKIVSPVACDHMLELLKREPRTLDLENGKWFVMRHGVPSDAQVWSKDGATGLEWHDSAIIALPDGRKYILVVFTHFKEDTTPFISLYTRNILNALK
jgi:beta-lactamase class A